MSDHNIVRTHKRAEPFVRIDSGLINDSRLGWDTRGLLGYLLSKPDHWEVRMTDLENAGPSGMYAIRRMMKEASQYGYVSRTRENQPNGRFRWVTNVYESPNLNPSFLPSRGLPSMGEPSMGEPSMANREIYKRSNIVTTNLSNDLILSNDVSDDDAWPCSVKVKESLSDFNGRADQGEPHENRFVTMTRFVTMLRNHVNEQIIAATGADWDGRDAWIESLTIPGLRAALIWCEVYRQRTLADPDAVRKPIGFIRSGVEDAREPGLSDNHISAIDDHIALMLDISESEALHEQNHHTPRWETTTHAGDHPGGPASL